MGPQGVDADALRSAYRSALEAARAHGLRSVALCAVSTGIFGYDVREATPIALHAVREWLEEAGNAAALDAVVFCVFSNADRAVYEVAMATLFPLSSESIAAYQREVLGGR